MDLSILVAQAQLRHRDKSSNSKFPFPALKGKTSVYMITKVLMAKTIEFRVTRETSSRIFHLGNASPLVFGLEEFLIGDDGKLIAKVSLSQNLYEFSILIAITKKKIQATALKSVHLLR